MLQEVYDAVVSVVSIVSIVSGSGVVCNLGEGQALPIQLVTLEHFP